MSPSQINLLLVCRQLAWRSIVWSVNWVDWGTGADFHLPERRQTFVTSGNDGQGRMLLQATVMRFIGARKHAARCNQTLAAKCSEISSDFLVKLHSCRATKALRNYNHWTDFLPFCRRVCSPAQSATSKKKDLPRRQRGGWKMTALLLATVIPRLSVRRCHGEWPRQTWSLNSVSTNMSRKCVISLWQVWWGGNIFYFLL